MSSSIKCFKKRVLVDCRVVVHPWPSDLKIAEPYTMENELTAKERFAKKLETHFQKHLELGVHSVAAECDFQDQCSHCGDAWHEDVDNNGVVRCARCGNEMEVVR